MASRLAVQSLRAASRVRPASAVSSIPKVVSARSMSSDRQPPAERASQLINSVPSNSFASKTGTIVIGTGLAAAAISQELYVINEEAVVLAGFAILATYIGKIIREPYKQWAEGHIAKIKGVLDGARAQHTEAVKSRIDSVAQMKDVAAITEGLFALSKETAKLESDAFVQRQRVALASELKTVLDSWVRFEQQAKESEQAQLAKTVVDSVLKSLSDEKTQKEILVNAVAEIDQLVKAKAI
ncbi:ATP synthase [Pyrrhoderma noxium]|uniref:ATP synthase subunit 4 n=1 Tax=Pyrrhoderma noxium TaxID=2282107 RepID=A0A286UJM8_9AGAM|nr:ATP synthase [Pyrrhoderma noxium]